MKIEDHVIDKGLNRIMLLKGRHAHSRMNFISLEQDTVKTCA
jgi:hypothetical protein